MTTEETFATWVATKRAHLLAVAKAAREAVSRTRSLGNPLEEIHHAQEEWARRLERAAEALGPNTIDEAAPPEDWVASDKEGYVHCRSCKQDIKDVPIGKLRHAGSKGHRDAMALQKDP